MAKVIGNGKAAPWWGRVSGVRGIAIGVLLSLIAVAVAALTAPSPPLLGLPAPMTFASYEYFGPGSDRNHPVAFVVDDSAWNIDTPEDPDSVLALKTWSSWQGRAGFDLRDATVTILAQGEGLDLRGGYLDFWVVDDGGRWHHPLPIPLGQRTSLPLVADAAWHRSWSRNEPRPLALSTVRSYGIGFVGFDAEPTGRLIVEELTFSR